MPVLHKYKDREKYYVLTSYQKLLDSEFASRWEEIAKTNTSKQAKKQDQLFNFEDDQGKLL